jgi:uncharacterized protein (DUF736 family)
MAEHERDPNELGALWVKSSAKGEYMSGMINGEPVVCFRNDRKTSDKQPDWRVLKPRPRPTVTLAHPTPLTDDDIPF